MTDTMQAHGAPVRASQGVLSELMRVGLLIVDREGAPLFANALASDLLGCEKEQRLADSWARLQAELAIDVRALHNETRLLLARGTTSEPLQIEIQPLRSHSFEGAVVLLKDGVADEALSRELVLASRMRAQNYLFGSLLHDLRAPLNAMEINLELLTDTCHEMRDNFVEGAADVPRRQSDQIVAVLKEELTRLNRSLRMVLDNGQPQPMEETFDLAMAVRELAVLLRPQARRQHIAIELELPDSGLLIKGQRDQVKQALLNIAINGLEAMPQRGTLQVAVRPNKLVGSVDIVFADTGAGMPQAVLDRARRVYFTTKPTGTGMGLFVTELVAEAHGGNLLVANAPHGGAVVTLRLPLPAGSPPETGARSGTDRLAAVAARPGWRTDSTKAIRRTR